MLQVRRFRCVSDWEGYFLYAVTIYYTYMDESCSEAMHFEVDWREKTFLKILNIPFQWNYVNNANELSFINHHQLQMLRKRFSCTCYRLVCATIR